MHSFRGLEVALEMALLAQEAVRMVPILVVEDDHDVRPFGLEELRASVRCVLEAA